MFAVNPDPLVYRVKIQAKYKDSSGNLQFTYYTIKFIGDPCYNLLDENSDDPTTRIELMSKENYRFG